MTWGDLIGAVLWGLVMWGFTILLAYGFWVVMT